MSNDSAHQGDFTGFGLHNRLLVGLEKNNFTAPTPIQAEGILPQMAGRDLMGLAQTGTGKTAAFGLPLLHELIEAGIRPNPKTCRSLILCPTRELAVQIEETLRKLSGGARLSFLLVLGGIPRNRQIRMLSKGVDVLIATPGRLTDLMQEGHVRFDETSVLILDEADRMLDMGFVKPVQRIAAKLHPRRRTALFSATMPREVEGLAASLLSDPVRIEVASPGETVTKIEQSVELLPHADKRARLAEIVSGEGVGRVIVFARTKRGADRVAENLEKDGIKADAIHGNKAQNARQRALKSFSDGRVRVLVATDIAARGIDVKDITHVVQYELPDEPEAYVHRIGRTGRNGADGTAIALCCPDERDKLRAIEKLTRLRLTPEGAEPAPRAKKSSRGGRPYRPENEHGSRPPRHRRERSGPRDRNSDRDERSADAQQRHEHSDGERPARGPSRPRQDGERKREGQPRRDRAEGERPARGKPSHHGKPSRPRSDGERAGEEGQPRRDRAEGERPARGKPAHGRRTQGGKPQRSKSADSRSGSAGSDNERRGEAKPRRDRAEGERPAQSKPRGENERGRDAKPRRHNGGKPGGQKSASRGDGSEPLRRRDGAKHGKKPAPAAH